jgi:hypothetical protein
MKIYLAARYSRNAEMRSIRDQLQDLGHEVTSRWIDQHGGNLLESIAAGKLNANPVECYPYAEIDVADLMAADIVISFTSADGGGKGGRHVEFGLALGLGKRVVLVGPRENVFHTLPAVEWHEDWASLLAAWFEPVVDMGYLSLPAGVQHDIEEQLAGRRRGGIDD